ncbi:MAG: DUF4230 domain-containing protein [Leptolyngbyaceae cyanobacterium]
MPHNWGLGRLRSRYQNGDNPRQPTYNTYELIRFFHRPVIHEVRFNSCYAHSQYYATVFSHHRLFGDLWTVALKPPHLDQPDLDYLSARSERGEIPPRQPQPPFLLRLVQGLLGSLSGGMLLIGMIAGVGLWRSGEDFVANIRSAFLPAEPVEEVDVQTVVVQQIRSASDLTTAIFTMEAVVPTSSSRVIANYEVGKTTLVYIAKGEVRAGVDLSAIAPAQVQTNGEVLRVLLPPAKIIDKKIDVGQSQVFDYDRGFLGLGPDRAPELQDKAQIMALQKIIYAACQEGIMQQASDRAELVVSQLLANTGFEQVIVESQPSTNSACAAAGASTVE